MSGYKTHRFSQEPDDYEGPWPKEQVMDTPTSLWIVLDPKDGPEFAAAWREGAHEHIKDAIEGGIQDASRWVVREYTPIAEVERLRAEVEALRVGDALHKVCVQQRDRAWREVESLRSKAAAFDEWLAKTEWVQETAEAGELGTHRADVMRKRIEALRADNKHLRGEFEKAWPDAERYRHLISAEPAWVVSLFENGFRPAEIVDLIDAARAAEEKK